MNQDESSGAVRRVALLGNDLPRRCGIATFGPLPASRCFRRPPWILSSSCSIVSGSCHSTAIRSNPSFRGN